VGLLTGGLWGRYSGLGLAIAATAFAIDQAHKWWTIHVYDIGSKGKVALTSFLDLVFVINTGVSYSLLEQSSWTGQALLSAFAVVVALALAIWLARAASRVTAAALGLLIGGALANALDRMIYGGVADFFSLHAFDFYWYVFNLADVAIVAGVIGLLYEVLWASRKSAANTT
jgi:signal peptidase II